MREREKMREKMREKKRRRNHSGEEVREKETGNGGNKKKKRET